MKTSPLALLLFLVPSLVAKAERNEEADYELKKDIPYLGKGQALSKSQFYSEYFELWYSCC